MYFMKNETLAAIVQTPKYVMDKTNVSDFRNIYNRNAAISKYYAAGYYDERAIGTNAGGTSVGGYCAVEVFRDSENGAAYLAVVMGASEDETTGEIYSYKNAKALLEWAFGSFGYVDVLSVDKIVGEIPVTLSSAVDYVTLRPSETVSVFLPKTIDPENDLELHTTTLLESLTAPVKAGDVVGTVTVTKDGEIVGTSDLVTSSDVERSGFLYVLSQIESFTKSKFFWATIICAVVLSLVYVFGKAFIRGRRSKRL
jgi:D-alanyl-D-alanine carboxypeptidase (penicillin-binding protein 5/6)